MERNNQYISMVAAIEALSRKGYTGNFSVTEDGLLNDGNGNTFLPTEVELNEFHHFEGETNRSDSSNLFVLKTNTGLKGIVVDYYGKEVSLVILVFMNKIKQIQLDYN